MMRRLGCAPEVGKNAQSERGKSRVGPLTTPARTSEARFLPRSPDPADRFVRDGVLPEKEAQLGGVFLHMAQGVQEQLEIAHRLSPAGESDLLVRLLV